MKRVLVWDLAVRLFHVVLIAGFTSAYTIAKFLGEDSRLFPYHMMIGLTLGAAVAYRFIWGFLGPKWSRLTSLWHGPASHLEYARNVFNKNAKRYVGHNPASSLAIIAILVLVLSLAVTGYIMSQGNEGMKGVHEILANALAVVSFVHIAGVLLHSFIHRDGIVMSMVHGKKEADPTDAIAGAAPLAALAFAALVAFLFGGFLANYDSQKRTTQWPLSGGTINLGEHEEETNGHAEKGSKEHTERHEREE